MHHLKQYGLRSASGVLVFMSVLWMAPWPTRADDWPQWLGPQRDGIWRETGILDTFPAGGPPVRWRVAIGAGYSGPAVADGRVYVFDRLLDHGTSNPKDPFPRGTIPGSERVLCLNEADGKILWQFQYPCAYDISYPAGPRTTPTVKDGKVYTLGAVGNLNCLEAATGKVLWSHQFKKDYGVESPLWGFAGHPLIDGQKLICLARGEGTTVVAFDKDTGKEIWRALSAPEPGYSAPVIYEAGGRRQLIIWHPEALNSLDPDTGKVFWSQRFASRTGLTIATPRKMGDYLFVSSFYNGSLMMRLATDRPTATEVWRGQKNSERNTDGLHSIISTPFLEDGYIYGVCSYGQFRCLKAESGERIWETFVPTGGQEMRWANAFIIKNGNRFFLPNEKGDLLIAKLSPQGYQEISRTHLLEPANTDPQRAVVWSHPAFANRNVYARNDKEIVCVSLAQSDGKP
jgi:outer membrane protein assembly factor BamB